MASQQEQNGREDNAMDKANRTLCSCCAGGRFFEIRVRGHLDGKWSDGLEGLKVQSCSRASYWPHVLRHSRNA